ncbi:MAG TPA: BatA domain-containing protein, partial [Gemmatimonadales bacterium]|nr:BatA domain-containing protein [Gemmatimonadales bacterium]
LAVAVVVLHFIVTRDPATVAFPTARFAPDRPARARARALRLSDILLLVCRAGLLGAVGLAMAQPIPAPRRRSLARIVLVDQSGSVADPAAVRDSARAWLTPGDAALPFDSGAATGSISAALVAGLRRAFAWRDRADSLEMVVISAFAAGERDRATDSIRRRWPGRIRLVQVSGPRDSAAPPAVVLRTGADDPLQYALPPGGRVPDADVRLVRQTAEAADSVWAAAGDHALVLWPRTLPGPVRDTVGAVSAGDIAIVAPFARVAPAAMPGRVLARWLDGTPAAVETSRGQGCIRTITIPVPSTGDLVLDPRFQRLVSRLLGRCGDRPQPGTLDGAYLAGLEAGAGGGTRVAGAALGRPTVVRSPLSPWLLAAALALGVAELAIRRRRRARHPAEASA